MNLPNRGGSLLTARFHGTETSVEPLDREDLTGRLLDVIDQVERFLDLHLRIPHSIHGFWLEPRPELLKEAWREAIVNAVALTNSLHPQVEALAPAFLRGTRLGLLYHPSASAMQRR